STGTPSSRPSSRSSTKSRTSSGRSERSIVSPPSVARRASPIAARRSPNGSREPGGRWPRSNGIVSGVRVSAAGTSVPACRGGGGGGGGPAGGMGKVLPLDRLAARFRVAGEPGVLRADVALEVGELADELRRLVGLGEPCRLACRLSPAERSYQPQEPLR